MTKTFTVTIPTLEKLSNFAVWDQSVGLFLAIVLATTIGLYIGMTMLASGFLGSKKDNMTWVMINFFVGLGLSLAMLVTTGSWFAGCGVAIISFFALRTIRERAGG